MKARSMESRTFHQSLWWQLQLLLLLLLLLLRRDEEAEDRTRGPTGR